MTQQQLAPYLLGHSDPELERLKEQPAQLAEEATWLLDRMQIQPGHQVIELGCGPQGVLDQLSARVGAAGEVVGIDQGSGAVTMARAFAWERNLANVEVRHGDAADTGYAPDSFDAAFTRLVLVNVPNPEAIVAEAVRLTRPGGVVAFHEADFVCHLCDPPSEAWTRLLDAYMALFAQSGIDLRIGRRLPGLLRAAGLAEVEARPLVHIYPPGHPRRTILPQFVGNVRERLIDEGLLDERELDDLIRDVGTHIADPGTLVMSHLFIQSWGRKPATK